MHRSSYEPSFLSTPDVCPRCSGALMAAMFGVERDYRVCDCGYWRPAPRPGHAKLMLVGAANFRTVCEALDRYTPAINVGVVIASGSFREARRWAVLNHANWIGDMRMTTEGLVKLCTHLVSFGVTEELLVAEGLGKPNRLVQR